MSTSLLKVEDLNIAFTTYGRRQHILKDVSFEIGRGERVALIGETGGKIGHIEGDPRHASRQCAHRKRQHRI